MRFVRSESIEIGAARDQVFALVCDIPNRDDWPAKGEIQVVTSAPPHRCVYDCSESGSRFRWTFDLTTSPTGTTVHQTVERVGAPGWAKIVQPFAWELSQCGQVRAGLAQLKMMAERSSVTLPHQRTVATSGDVPTAATKIGDAYS